MIFLRCGNMAEKKVVEEAVEAVEVIEEKGKRIVRVVKTLTKIQERVEELTISLEDEWEQLVAGLSDQNVQQVYESIKEFTSYKEKDCRLGLSSSASECGTFTQVCIWMIRLQNVLRIYQKELKYCQSPNGKILEKFYRKFNTLYNHFARGHDVSDMVCLEGWLPIIGGHPLREWFTVERCVEKAAVLASNKLGECVALRHGWTKEDSVYVLKLFTPRNKLFFVEVPFEKLAEVDVVSIYESTCQKGTSNERKKDQWEKLVDGLSEQNFDQVYKTIKAFTPSYKEKEQPNLPSSFSDCETFTHVCDWMKRFCQLLYEHRKEWSECSSPNSKILKHFFNSFSTLHKLVGEGHNISQIICSEGWIPVINGYPLSSWFVAAHCADKEIVLASNQMGEPFSGKFGWRKNSRENCYYIKFLTSQNKLVTICIPTRKFTEVDVTELLLKKLSQIQDGRVVVDDKWEKLVSVISDRPLQELYQSIKNFTSYKDNHSTRLPPFQDCQTSEDVFDWMYKLYYLLYHCEEEWEKCSSPNSTLLLLFQQKFRLLSKKYGENIDISDMICEEGWLPVINGYPLREWFHTTHCKPKKFILSSNSKAPCLPDKFGWKQDNKTCSLKLINSHNILIVITVLTREINRIDVAAIYYGMDQPVGVIATLK